MREVPASLYGFMYRVLERYGLKPAEAVRGLPLEAVNPARLGERVDWDDLARFLNRCTEGLSLTEQEALGELYPLENRFMHVGAQVVGSPRVFYRLLGYATRAGMPHLRTTWGTEPDGRIMFDVRLPEHHTPSPVFFVATVGEFRCLTELFGLGSSEVEADVGPWHGCYLIRLPEGADDPTFRGRVAEPLVDGIATLLRWILTQDAPDGEPVDARRLRREHGMTWIEAHVALHLARGDGIATVAAALGMSPEAVQEHVRRLEAKLSGPRFHV
jgi:DNA-binding CsgD family transcriptional regulator